MPAPRKYPQELRDRAISDEINDLDRRTHADHPRLAAAARHRPLVHDAGPQARSPEYLGQVKGRGVNLDAELDDMQAALAQGNKDSWREMLRKPFLRATIFVVGLAFFVQITPNAQQGMNDVRVLDREPSHGAVHLAQALALLGHPTNTR